MQEPGKHRARDEWGPKEIIALVIIGSSFALAAIGLITDKVGATLPAWVAALVGGVSLYLYKNGNKT